MTIVNPGISSFCGLYKELAVVRLRTGLAMTMARIGVADFEWNCS